MPLKSRTTTRSVEALAHDDAKRKHIATAETQSYLAEEEARPKKLKYPRNPNLDPQLVWRGKDAEDESALYVDSVPIYIQQKISGDSGSRHLRPHDRRGTIVRRERHCFLVHRYGP